MGPKHFRVGNRVNGGTVLEIRTDRLIVGGPLNIHGIAGIVYKDVKPDPITPDELIKFGFERKPEVSWYGNGHDGQDNPTSRTIQHDYVKDYGSENQLIVRYTHWSYRKDQDSEWISDPVSMGIHFVDEWYEKCQGYIPSSHVKYIHDLQNLFWEIARLEL